MTNTFLCDALGCRFSRGGICNENEITIEGCNGCLCTFTKFRKCRPIEECIQGKAKSGECPKIYTTFLSIAQYLCITQKIRIVIQIMNVLENRNVASCQIVS
nr:unnamed protein product [Callosobruchus chinensis]